MSKHWRSGLGVDGELRGLDLPPEFVTCRNQRREAKFHPQSMRRIVKLLRSSKDSKRDWSSLRGSQWYTFAQEKLPSSTQEYSLIKREVGFHLLRLIDRRTHRLRPNGPWCLWQSYKSICRGYQVSRSIRILSISKLWIMSKMRYSMHICMSWAARRVPISVSLWRLKHRCRGQMNIWIFLFFFFLKTWARRTCLPVLPFVYHHMTWPVQHCTIQQKSRPIRAYTEHRASADNPGGSAAWNVCRSIW